MKIETYPDKLNSSENELQALVKQHVLQTTGRVVDGDVHFQLANGSRADSQASFWCTLKPEESK